MSCCLPASTIDSGIHWLTGGPVKRYYEELDILPAVELRVLKHWTTYRDVRTGLCAVSVMISTT